MRYHANKAGLEPKITPSDLDIAWAAGVYEGEGSCVRSGKGKNSFCVSVAQKDPELLYRLRDLFGGSVKEYPNNRGTKFTNGKSFTVFAWRVSGNYARLFLAVIYSYLTTRRKAQIDATAVRLFLDLLGTVPQQGAFGFVYARLAIQVTEQLELRKKSKTEYQRQFHEDHKSDRAYMEKRRQQVRDWRSRNKLAKVVAIA